MLIFVIDPDSHYWKNEANTLAKKLKAEIHKFASMGEAKDEMQNKTIIPDLIIFAPFFMWYSFAEKFDLLEGQRRTQDAISELSQNGKIPTVLIENSEIVADRELYNEFISRYPVISIPFFYEHLENAVQEALASKH